MIKVYFILFLVFISSLSFGQEIEEDLRFSRPRYAIGFSPLAEINNYQTFQISQDIRIIDFINLHFETGYIHNQSNRNRSLTGYRLRGAVEFMVYPDNNGGLLVSAFYNYRKTFEDEERTIYHLEDYTERIPYVGTGTLKGMGLGLGYIFRINDDFNFKFIGGLGYGDLEVVFDKTLPRSNRWEWEGVFFNLRRMGRHEYPIVFLNFNFSYNIF